MKCGVGGKYPFGECNMNIDRLDDILSRMRGLTIGVLGDFFLDLYLDLDESLSEISIETGLESYQAVNRRCQPGAAGNTAINLAVIGAGSVRAVGAIGDDGNGFDLRRSLEDCGVNCCGLIAAHDFFTPTYTKPLMRMRSGSLSELNRIDIKNRSPLSAGVESVLEEYIRSMFDVVDCLIVIDQVQEENCGAITARIRECLVRLANENPGKHLLVDSRSRIALFPNFIIKPNITEACGALGINSESPKDVDARDVASRLFEITGRPVYITMGERGCVVCGADGAMVIPAFKVNGEIDPVGAGDAFLAAVAASLCAGADTWEAAILGNLAASVTVGKVGTTGAASPEELRAQWERVFS